MEGMNDMLGSLLNDPESMQQLKELADMLNDETSQSGGSEPSEGTQENGGNMFGGIDIGTVMEIAGLISGTGGGDKDSELLLALKPHVNTARQEKIDKAVKLLRIYAVLNVLKDSGMLGKLSDML